MAEVLAKTTFSSVIHNNEVCDEIVKWGNANGYPVTKAKLQNKLELSDLVYRIKRQIHKPFFFFVVCHRGADRNFRCKFFVICSNIYPNLRSFLAADKHTAR